MRKLLPILLLILPACNGPQDKQLDARIARLTTERDRAAAIAAHLDEYRAEVVRLEADLGRTGEVEPVTDPAPTLKKMEANAGGASVGYQQPARFTGMHDVGIQLRPAEDQDKTGRYSRHRRIFPPMSFQHFFAPAKRNDFGFHSNRPALLCRRRPCRRRLKISCGRLISRPAAQQRQ